MNLRQSRADGIKLPALVAAEWLATADAVRRTEVVHAHWILPQGFVAATTPRRRVPRVLTVHGGDVYGLRGRVLDRFSRMALRRSDRVTVNSSATASAVTALAGPQAQIDLVPMGVDTGRTLDPHLVDTIRQRYRGQGGPLLVYVGRVVEEKGVEDAVAAVARIRASRPGVQLVIVGAGQHVERVRHLSVRLGVGDRVHLAGWAPPDDVPSWFAAADVVLAPSRIGPNGWQEGQGLTILEAMTAGAVVVATRTGGIPDTISHGGNGLLVDPADPAAIADAVEAATSRPEWAQQLAAAARGTVAERFDRAASAARFDAIYRELTDRVVSGG